MYQTVKADLLVPEQLKTNTIPVKTSFPPTKVDVPSPGVSTSLGKVSATSTINTSVNDLEPATGATGTGHDILPDQELSKDKSLPGRSDKESEEGGNI